MAYKLSNAAFKKIFEKKASAVPEGFAEDSPLFFGRTESSAKELDDQLIRDFFKVLEAEKPSDVSDVPDEQLLMMFRKLGDLSDCVCLSDRFTNGKLFNVLRAKQGIKRRRRVL